MNWHQAKKLAEEIQRDCHSCGPVEHCWKGENCVLHIAKPGVVTPFLVTSREDYEKLKREGALE